MSLSLSISSLQLLSTSLGEWPNTSSHINKGKLNPDGVPRLLEYSCRCQLSPFSRFFLFWFLPTEYNIQRSEYRADLWSSYPKFVPTKNKTLQYQSAWKNGHIKATVVPSRSLHPLTFSKSTVHSVMARLSTSRSCDFLYFSPVVQEESLSEYPSYFSQEQK